ncbi:MAG: alpha/beta hydrolase domain-containing protein, partial [Pseudomonadota bacterium]
WGNELGGIRHPFIDEPLAAFLPWAIRNQGFAPNELMDFKGALILMSKSNVLDRYDSWDAYLTKLNVAIDNAIEERVLLPRDRERLIEQARWLWDKVMASQSNE